MRGTTFATIVTAMIGILTVAAPPAFALEPKQCLPMAAMNDALRAEGQRTIIIGDRTTPVTDNTQVGRVRIARWVNTFTSNADGSVGYNLEGDKPAGEPSTRVCVGAKFTRIRLYDTRRSGTPDAARRGARFNAELAENEVLGTRPMLQADSVSTGADGILRQGLSITLLQNARSKAAWFVALYPDDTTRDLYDMRGVEYTAEGLSRLR